MSALTASGRVAPDYSHQLLLSSSPERRAAAGDAHEVPGRRRRCCTLSVCPWVCPGCLLPLAALAVALFPEESDQLRNGLRTQLGVLVDAAWNGFAPGPAAEVDGAADEAPSTSLPLLEPAAEHSPELTATVEGTDAFAAEVAALSHGVRDGPSANGTRPPRPGSRAGAGHGGHGGNGSARAHTTKRLRTTTPPPTTTTTLSLTTVSTTPSTTALQCDECAPAQRDRPSVMIPVYERDLCKLKVTARSLVAHDPEGILGKVFICWVSGRSRYEFAAQLDEITHILEEHGDVEVLEMQLGGMSGWIAQQSAKLKVASRVLSEYYVVLDAKNTLLVDIGPETFFTPCNQAKVFGRYDLDNMPTEHREWFGMSAGVLGQQVMDWGKWPASVTPMVLHRQTTLDLLTRLGESPDFDSGVCAGGLCDKFSQKATEFTLYLVYAAQIASFDCIHAIEERPWGDELSISIWREDTEGTAVQVKAIADHSDLNGRPFFFGSQAGALDSFDPAERLTVLKDLFTIYDTAGVYDWESWDEMADCVVGRGH